MEAITFPSPEASVYRRSVSIDFTIPAISPVPANGTAVPGAAAGPGHTAPSSRSASGDGEPPSQAFGRYYVPLSLLKKWPPVNRLDLRSTSGESVPLLTTKQNGVVDAELLVALAEAALGEAKLLLPSDVAAEIRLLAQSRGDNASRAFLSLLPPNKLGVPDEVHQTLRRDRVFTDLAGGLRDSTILWLRVDGYPGNREIVKFDYEIPIDWRVGEWTTQAFGFKPFSTKIESPHFGGASSYHLNIRLPSPLSVCDAELGIIDPKTAEGAPDAEEVVADCTAAESEKAVQVAHGVLQLYASRAGQEARFYISGDRTGARGEAWIALLLAKRALPAAGALGSAGVAAVLTAYALRLTQVLAAPEPSVAVLLVIPALLAYLVVRPAGHRIVGQFLAAARRFVLVTAGLPLIGAVGIVINGKAWSSSCKILFAALAVVAWIAAGVLVASAFLPRGRNRRPFSEPK